MSVVNTAEIIKETPLKDDEYLKAGVLGVLVVIAILWPLPRLSTSGIADISTP